MFGANPEDGDWLSYGFDEATYRSCLFINDAIQQMFLDDPLDFDKLLASAA